MSRTPDARMRDNQTKRIQERISNVEKHFGEMCQAFAAYGRNSARLRDKADLLVRELGEYSDTETPSLKTGLKHFASHLAKIQDYRQAQVERLDAKVIEPLKGYGAVVKRKRDDVKQTQSARTHESKKMDQLERTRQKNPSDRQVISQAESDLQRATMDATRTTRQLEETMDEFEKQKIRDLKKILSDFVTVEMSFHAKALELYTLAYQSIQSVEEEEDLKVFRNSLHPPDYLTRSDMVGANSRTSLEGTTSFLSASTSFQQQRASGRQASREEEEEDEDESEEEEEDDSEGES
ncbi:CBY1-interacting BAR domain-containing protein 1 [Nerophis ophidion]|uniref:CBY1-interacting BAR domain-containing protein 1 n=1 Tax=Nerophis ophidion TaxID=159077 RepID=UPI002AE0094B|nr:CBY1-interacting BAR domain-containing protein 1 [Nerophis ophidion]